MVNSESSPPLVSIGIPVHNGGEQIKKLLSSLLSQSYRNLEIIVSDNASQDSTLLFLRKSQLEDSRIRVLESEILIPAHQNFQRVLDAASGEFFMWAAHDDFHSKDFVENTLKKLEESTAYKACHSGANFVLDTDNLLIYRGMFYSLINSQTPSRLYMNVLNGINSLFFYALFRTQEAKSISPLKSGPGAELLWLFEFCLRYRVTQIPMFGFFYTLRSEGANPVETSNSNGISSYITAINRLFTFHASFLRIANQYVLDITLRRRFKIVFFLNLVLKAIITILFAGMRFLLPRSLKLRFSAVLAHIFRSLNSRNIWVVNRRKYIEIESLRLFRRWF